MGLPSRVDLGRGRLPHSCEDCWISDGKTQGMGWSSRVEGQCLFIWRPETTIHVSWSVLLWDSASIVSNRTPRFPSTLPVSRRTPRKYWGPKWWSRKYKSCTVHGSGGDTRGIINGTQVHKSSQIHIKHRLIIEYQLQALAYLHFPSFVLPFGRIKMPPIGRLSLWELIFAVSNKRWLWYSEPSSGLGPAP